VSSKSGAIQDVYIWLFKRMLEHKKIANELLPFINKQIPKSRSDEISINAISSRWQKWFEKLPEPTEGESKKGKELMEIDEERRIRGMSK